MSRPIAAVLAFLVATAAIVLVTAAPAHPGSNQAWDVDGGASPIRQMAPMQVLAVMPHPTDPDPLGDSRAAASRLAADEPERKGVAILPELAAFLAHTDPVVRRFAADAVRRIAMSGAANDSGFRAAMQASTTVRDGLLDTVGYRTTADSVAGTEMRVSAVTALLWLYYERPDSGIESQLTRHYNREWGHSVRAAIVEVLCEHHDSSPSTREVLMDAAADFDRELATRAQGCLSLLPQPRQPDARAVQEGVATAAGSDSR